MALRASNGNGDVRRGKRCIAHKKRMRTWDAAKKFDLSTHTYQNFDGSSNTQEQKRHPSP